MANKECMLCFLLIVVISVHLEECCARAVGRVGEDEVDDQFADGGQRAPKLKTGSRKISLDEFESKAFDGNVRSDVIQTKFPGDEDSDQDKPGWMRRQLMRFGNIASAVSSKMGGSAAKVAGYVEKICKIMKTMIPIVAAVCHVGQFQFCSSPDGPTELAVALANPNSLDLNIPD